MHRRQDSPGDNFVAVDLGEINPAAATDGEEGMVVSCRALRSLNQYTNKRLAELSHKQAAKVKGSRGWRRLQRRKNRFLAQQRRRKRDIEHKISREVAGTLWELATSCHSPYTARLGESYRPARSSVVSHSVGQTSKRSSGPLLTRAKESVVPWTRDKWLLQVW